jgi:hypothetical protein
MCESSTSSHRASVFNSIQNIATTICSPPQIASPTATMSSSLILTKLPPELRTMIWEFTLQVPPTNPYDIHQIIWLTPDPNPHPSVLSLLLTCRQIHHEAATIFYDINQLSVNSGYRCETDPGPTRIFPDTIGSLSHFLKSLGPRRLSSLRSLCVWVGEGRVDSGWPHWDTPLVTTLKRLRGVSGLRTVHLMWDQPLRGERAIVSDIPEAVTRALSQMRQVEQVTVWGRDASQEDESLGSRAKFYGDELQRHLPRYKARHRLDHE